MLKIKKYIFKNTELSIIYIEHGIALWVLLKIGTSEPLYFVQIRMTVSMAQNQRPYVFSL